MAGRVDLFLPANLTTSTASIWVIDDGESMDFAELEAAWEIAR